MTSSSQWLLVGWDGVRLHLAQRSDIVAHGYEGEHPVVLPHYPTLSSEPVVAPTQGLLSLTMGPVSTNVDSGPSSPHMSGVVSTNVDPAPSVLQSVPAASTNMDPAASQLTPDAASSTNVDLASSTQTTEGSGSVADAASRGTSPLTPIDD